MKAFSLVNAPHLPVTGEAHPLVRESMRWLTTGNAIALLFGIVVFAALYAWAALNQDDTTSPPVVITDPRIIDPRPVISPRVVHGGGDVSKEKMGEYEPVTEVTEVEKDDVVVVAGPGTGERVDGPFDPPVGDPAVFEPGFEPAVQDTFVAFDEYPELLRIDAPIYPSLAQQAGLEGRVMVKVQITRAGKVKQAVAVEGPEVFWKSAITAAHTALFTPAKQGDTPVEVWVIIPVTFALNR